MKSSGLFDMHAETWLSSPTNNTRSEKVTSRGVGVVSMEESSKTALVVLGCFEVVRLVHFVYADCLWRQDLQPRLDNFDNFLMRPLHQCERYSEACTAIVSRSPFKKSKRAFPLCCHRLWYWFLVGLDCWDVNMKKNTSKCHNPTIHPMTHSKSAP